MAEKRIDSQNHVWEFAGEPYKDSEYVYVRKIDGSKAIQVTRRAWNVLKPYPTPRSGPAPTMVHRDEVVINPAQMNKRKEADDILSHVTEMTFDATVDKPFISRLFSGSIPVSEEGWLDLGATRSGTFIAQADPAWTEQIMDHFGVEPLYEKMIEEHLEIQREAKKKVELDQELKIAEIFERDTPRFEAVPLKLDDQQGFFLDIDSYKWATRWVQIGIDAVKEKEATTKVEIEKDDLNFILDWAHYGAGHFSSSTARERIDLISKELLPGKNRTE